MTVVHGLGDRAAPPSGGDHCGRRLEAQRRTVAAGRRRSGGDSCAYGPGEAGVGSGARRAHVGCGRLTALAELAAVRESWERRIEAARGECGSLAGKLRAVARMQGEHERGCQVLLHGGAGVRGGRAVTPGRAYADLGAVTGREVRRAGGCRRRLGQGEQPGRRGAGPHREAAAHRSARDAGGRGGARRRSPGCGSWGGTSSTCTRSAGWSVRRLNSLAHEMRAQQRALRRRWRTRRR